MKRHLLALLIMAASLAVRARPGPVAVIKQEAAKCAQALLAGDYATLVKYTHPRVVALIGGPDQMIAVVKEGSAKMRADGVEFVSVTVGQPQEPQQVGAWLTAFVPEHIVMKIPDGRMHVESYLLGLSEDGGKSWVFIDVGPMTKEQFARMFPELGGKLALPEKKQPELRKDEPSKPPAGDKRTNSPFQAGVCLLRQRCGTRDDA